MPHLHFLEFQRLGLINPLHQIARKEASITSGTPLHHATSEHSRVPLRGNGFQSISLWGVSARGSLLLQSCSPSTRLRASWSAQRILVSPAGRRTLLIKDSLTSLALLAISPAGHRRFAPANSRLRILIFRRGWLQPSSIAATQQPFNRMADERGRASLPTTDHPILAGASLLAPFFFCFPHIGNPRTKAGRGVPSKALFPLHMVRFVVTSNSPASGSPDLRAKTSSSILAILLILSITNPA